MKTLIERMEARPEVPKVWGKEVFNMQVRIANLEHLNDEYLAIIDNLARALERVTNQEQ